MNEKCKKLNSFVEVLMTLLDPYRCDPIDSQPFDDAIGFWKLFNDTSDPRFESIGGEMKTRQRSSMRLHLIVCQTSLFLLNLISIIGCIIVVIIARKQNVSDGGISV